MLSRMLSLLELTMKPWPLMMGLFLTAGLGLWLSHAEAGDEGRARKLINSQGCKACHALEGDGGKLAGSFETFRETLSRAEVRLQLVNPDHRHGNGLIADFSHLSGAEIDALVEFIQPQP